MKNYQNFVGIDVSKATLDIGFFNEKTPNEIKYLQIKNTDKSISELLKKLPANSLICFEHTGNYGLKLCYIFSKKKIDYWVVNPLEIKRSKGLVRGKSDKADSKDIANYAFTHKHKVKLHIMPDEQLLKIRLLLAQRDKFVKCIGMLTNTNETLSNHPNKVKKAVLQTTANSVKYLKKQLAIIANKIKAILMENETLNKKVELAKSVPGVGDQTALNLLIKTQGFTSFKNSRQFACYAGIAPFQYTSGSSIKGKTKVSNIADKKMKALLSIAALSAKRYDPQLNAYFNRKVAEGKNKMLVMNNIRNKMIARVFATVKRGTPYVNTAKYNA